MGKKGANVTLNQWYHQYGEKRTHEAVVRYAKKFTKAHSDIAVDVGWNPGDYYGKLGTSLLHGGPDVHEAHATIERVKAKNCVSLDDLVSDEQRKDTVAAYEKLVELNNSKSLLVGFTTDWFGPQAFVQAFCAMAWGGLWMTPAVLKDLGDDFGVVPWPKMTGVANATPATFIGGWSEMVNGKGKHQKQAKELVKSMWVDNADIQRDFNLSYGFHLPPRKSVAENVKALQSGHPRDSIGALEKYGKPTPPSPYWNDAMDATLIDAVGRIVKKGASVEIEVGKAASKCGAELKKTIS